MYQALYRTWRPARFADIVGQDAIVRTLLNQIHTGRISHAYLFCGSRGTGKTSTAKTFARALNCLDPQNGEPCGHCDACLDEQSGSSMDVIEIDAASNNGVDEIRDLRDRVMYPPAIGKYRIYIIDEVHMLSAGAFNALLKTLEEPPAHAVFILATTEPQRLPATILSRCQRFDFKRITVQVMVDHMSRIIDSQGMPASRPALEQIALAAEGGMRDALSILDMCISYAQDSGIDEAVVTQVLGSSGRAFMLEFTGALLAEDAARALRLVDELMRQGRDVQVFMRELLSHLRALMLSRIVGDEAAELLEITREAAQALSAQSASASPERLMAIMDIFLEAERDARYLAHSRVLLEMAIVRACRRGKVEDISALVVRLDQLEKQLEQGALAAPRAPAAPAATRKPRSAPARPAPVEGDDASKYRAALDRIKKTAMDIFAIARRGEFVQVRGDEVIVEFAPAQSAMAQIMDMPNNSARMSEALSECFGRTVRYRAVLRSEQDSPAPAGDLGPIYDAFGRENVQVIDENPDSPM